MSIRRLYRPRNNLETKKGKIIRKGCVFAGSEIGERAVEVLLERGIIHRVSTPPLSALPEYEKNAAKLKRQRILTVEDFILADPETLAAILLAEEAEVRDRQRQLLIMLSIPPRGG